MPGGLDGWDPDDLKLLCDSLYGHIADLLQMVEDGAKWPKETTLARAPFLAKKDDSNQPEDFRLLLVMSTLHRMWARMRLQDIMP